MFRYQLYCTVCYGEDDWGCFYGDYRISHEAYETPEQAAEAAMEAIGDVPWWAFIVTDKEGDIVDRRRCKTCGSTENDLNLCYICKSFFCEGTCLADHKAIHIKEN